MFKLQDKWVWDSWFCQHQGQYHLFFLQADRCLNNPDLRHFSPSIGHAVSEDLLNWRLLPDALAPSGDPESGQREAADSATTWTGSVLIDDDGLWHLFYTGSMRSEQSKIQRVCHATSRDGIHFEKCDQGQAIVEAKRSIYEGYHADFWHDEAWRDPWVYKNPEGDDYLMLITARLNTGVMLERGTVALCRSDNLYDWQVEAPFLPAGDFGQLEVPQLERIGEYWYLFFSTEDCHYSQRLQATEPERKRVWGTGYYKSRSPNGPWVLGRQFLNEKRSGLFYVLRAIHGPEGWCMIGFLNHLVDQGTGARGGFIGELSDPFALTQHADGELSLEGYASYTHGGVLPLPEGSSAS